MIDQNQHSDEFRPKTFESLVVDFAIRSLSQARHSAARLSQPQLEQLLAPSVDVVSKHFIQLRSFEKWEMRDIRKCLSMSAIVAISVRLLRVPKSRLFHQISFRTVVFKVAHYAVLNVGFSV
ncbi:hypothetical protein BLNAU_23878 [Blattamonas nauphoetae]|uniref:Uncharacterized protein n=1 Tax=Blattamonas nauphoetae TaxID=2049346 RepID=A0ABQ9WP12_9EUKA|nr:hypothetical protein BLNAU_23878 [Blattamonas nauphoetae]